MRNRLAEMRRQRGLSQWDLARLLDVPQPRVSEWERGIRTPLLETAFRIAHLLHCRIEDIFCYDGNGQAPYA